MDIYSTANQMKLERKTIFDMPMRVTFYARVSTTREEQENSIENQIAFFTDMIQKNENWEYIKGYIDRVRGESAENRASFMRMIEDGKAGKFDLILTKEVSRFARNTVDSLTYTRDLLRAGVGVFFPERQHLHDRHRQRAAPDDHVEHRGRRGAQALRARQVGA